MNIGLLGSEGFLGSAVRRYCQKHSVFIVPDSKSFDVSDPDQVAQWCESHSIDVIVNCCALVGGIRFASGNQHRLLMENRRIMSSVLGVAQSMNLSAVITPISNCIYPAGKTHYDLDGLFDGPPHDSVYGYGNSKRSYLIELETLRLDHALKSQYVNLIFPNMFGPGDHLDPFRAHALGAIVFKMCEAHANLESNLDIWGVPETLRQWCFVDRAAELLVLAATAAYQNPSVGVTNLNVNEGIVCTMGDLVKKIACVVGFQGLINYSGGVTGVAAKQMRSSVTGALTDWYQPRELDFIQALQETVKDVKLRRKLSG